MFGILAFIYRPSCGKPALHAVISCLLSGGKADLRGGVLRGPPLMSPDVDRHAASSLELSPSNSSGGTYMWDEEGMEPLGQNTHIHRCSSYESDLNSIVSTHISSQNEFVLPLECMSKSQIYSIICINIAKSSAY